MYQSMLLSLQTSDDGVFLPEDAGSAVVWVVFLAVVVALYIVVMRTRRRAEDEFWKRQREERERRNRPEPEDRSD